MKRREKKRTQRARATQDTDHTVSPFPSVANSTEFLCPPPLPPGPPGKSEEESGRAEKNAATESGRLQKGPPERQSRTRNPFAF